MGVPSHHNSNNNNYNYNNCYYCSSEGAIAHKVAIDNNNSLYMSDSHKKEFLSFLPTNEKIDMFIPR